MIPFNNPLEPCHLFLGAFVCFGLAFGSSLVVEGLSLLTVVWLVSAVMSLYLLVDELGGWTGEVDA